MKFAAIADIHGNYAALEAVLADIAALGIGEVVNLGDHLSGPLEPQRTADLLIARGFPSIRGAIRTGYWSNSGRLEPRVAWTTSGCSKGISTGSPICRRH